MAGDKTRPSSSVTVARYRVLEAQEARSDLGAFVRERFDERYFRPVQESSSKHGFALAAIACLVIEALESFYQGRGDTVGMSKQMFSDFFKRNTLLKTFGAGGDWFYKDVRCGILHQAEARGGWRILRRGPLLDEGARAINATLLLRELHGAVDAYAKALETDDALWALFKKKMAAVCANCA